MYVCIFLKYVFLMNLSGECVVLCPTKELKSISMMSVVLIYGAEGKAVRCHIAYRVDLHG